RGSPQIVLQHSPPSIRISNEIDAGDVDAHAPVGSDPAYLRQVSARGQHHVRGDAVLRQDATVTVNVVQEHLERADPLLESSADAAPVLCRHHPGKDIEAENLLGAAG